MQFLMCFGTINTYEPPHDKTNKMTVHPAKTQISRRVWSESSLCAQWVAKGPSFLHEDSEDWDDQADLSLRWAHQPFCWFCHVAAHMQNGKVVFMTNQKGSLLLRFIYLFILFFIFFLNFILTLKKGCFQGL